MNQSLNTPTMNSEQPLGECTVKVTYKVLNQC